VKVVYGHTDSIYVQCESVEKAEETIATINDEVRKIFPNVLGLEQHPVVLEFEKFYSSLGVGTTKNRNAGLVSWLDGVWLDEPKFAMTGFTAKKLAETKFAKDIQKTVLMMWVEQKSFDEINNYLNDLYSKVKRGEVDFTDIVKRSRFKPENFDLKCSCGRKTTAFQTYRKHTGGKFDAYCSKCGKDFSHLRTKDGKKPTYSAGSAGFIWAHQQNGLPLDVDSYVHIRVKPVGHFIHPITGKAVEATYVAGRTFEELQQFTPDWAHYAEQVVKKAEPIYKAMNWDTNKIRTKMKTLEEWF